MCDPLQRKQQTMKSQLLKYLCVLLIGHTPCRAHDVQFLVGGYLSEEGGDWEAATSPLNRPFGIDFTSAGRMFIVELEGGRVFRLETDGTLRRASGDGSRSYTGDGGPFALATWNGMHNCAVLPDDDLLIGDTWNFCVRRVNSKTRIVSTIVGTGAKGFSGDGGPAAHAAFGFVMCITLDPSGGILHIADLNNRRIRAVDMKTGIVTTVAGNSEKGVPVDGSVAIESPLVDPRAVAADSKGNVYILERGGNAVRVVRSDGTIHTVAGNGKKGHRDGPALQAEFGSPKHICIDDRDRVFIADDQNAAVRLFDPQSERITTVLGRGFGDKRIQLKNPHGVCWNDGWLYVVDSSHNRIMRLKVE
jgi:hypothetical protein